LICMRPTAPITCAQEENELQKSPPVRNARRAVPRYPKQRRRALAGKGEHEPRFASPHLSAPNSHSNVHHDQSSMGATAFRSRAQPLHVNITHTQPPTEIDVTESDPGFVGAVSLVSTGFSTGSFGWKGSKRMTIDLPKMEGQEEAEKVHVMLT
jgi:hypothetical protein